MTRVLSEKLGGFAAFLALVWGALMEASRPQRLEDEVRFEVLKGLVG
jgi:hypothetical protein